MFVSNNYERDLSSPAEALFSYGMF